MYKIRRNRDYDNDLEQNEDYSRIGRRDFLSYFGKGAVSFGLIAGASLISPLEAMADTVYYGKVKDAKKPAYIVYNEIAAKSKYQPSGRNDVNYNKIIAKRTESINKALNQVAYENGYDVVVEKDDPKIQNYVDITQAVIKKLEENEKNS